MGGIYGGLTKMGVFLRGLSCERVKGGIWKQYQHLSSTSLVDKGFHSVYGTSMNRREIKRTGMVVLAGFCLLGWGLASCASKNKVETIRRENLFRLDLGKLENQIDLVNMEGDGRPLKTSLVMRDGQFYISDNRGNKVVRYTSYGDLLSMIYNPDTNPPPLTLQKQDEEHQLVTRRAIPYPLISNGYLTVDSRRHIYVEDKLPVERQVYDQNNNVLLDSTVLHFDGDGNFVEYLGQEGIGGSPFPYITGIYTSVDDDVAVVCRLQKGWNVYWFDKEGQSRYIILIRSQDIPIPKGIEGFPVIDSLVVSPDSRQVYLKVDYYADLFDETTKMKTGIQIVGSYLWIMNVETGNYEKNMVIPFFEQTRVENDKKETLSLLYSLLGVANGHKVFFVIPVEEGYRLLVIDVESKTQKQSFIQVSRDELIYNALSLSPEGILSALLATEYEVKIVWWRTDSLTGVVYK